MSGWYDTQCGRCGRPVTMRQVTGGAWDPFEKGSTWKLHHCDGPWEANRAAVGRDLPERPFPFEGSSKRRAPVDRGSQGNSHPIDLDGLRDLDFTGRARPPSEAERTSRAGSPHAVERAHPADSAPRPWTVCIGCGVAIVGGPNNDLCSACLASNR